MDDCNVNTFLGSWGDQPEDHQPKAPERDAAEILTKNDWLEMAERWEALAFEAMQGGKAEEAAHRAAIAATFWKRAGLLGGGE